MSHACHRFWKCYKTLTFCSLLRRCTIPCACHAKRHLNVQKWSEPLVVFILFWLRNVLRARTACTFSTSQLLKVLRSWGALYILTSKCASRHNGVQFFDIWTSKSGPRLVCFVHFDFEMCFAPQRRALFRHLNFQKWSEHGVFCTFWLRNVLRATTFWLRSRRFSEPTFRPSRATNHWKNTVFPDFPTFSRICIFFLLTLSLLWSSLFYSSLLSDSSHLCFSSAHIVGSLTSKLPSITMCVCVLRVQEPNWTSPSATCSYFWGYTFLKPSINESRAIPELWNWLTGGCAPRILTFFLMVQKRDLGFQTTCPLVLKSNTNNRPRVIASAALLSFWSLPQQHHGKSIGYD